MEQAMESEHITWPAEIGFGTGHCGPYLDFQAREDARVAGGSEAMSSTAIKSRPIPFTAPMVRAILDGKKTQTRRAVKNAHIITCDDRVGVTDAKCPYGQPGDRLWVREHLYFDEDHGWQYADGKPLQCDLKRYGEMEHWLTTMPTKKRFHSSMFMHRWASRITLEIVSVRVERVQEITEDDARAEGVPQDDRGLYGDGNGYWHQNATAGFNLIWDSINGKKCPWDANPWVWRLEFRVVRHERENSP
jgi:hypothetical protein